MKKQDKKQCTEYNLNLEREYILKKKKEFKEKHKNINSNYLRRVRLWKILFSSLYFFLFKIFI